jgi:excisionase family DNA binding protein
MELLKPNDVARWLAVSRAWVYNAARTGRIPSIRIGGEDGPLRFVREDVEQWLDEARAGWTPGRRHRDGPKTRSRRSERKRSSSEAVLPGQQSLL